MAGQVCFDCTGSGKYASRSVLREAYSWRHQYTHSPHLFESSTAPTFWRHQTSQLREKCFAMYRDRNSRAADLVPREVAEQWLTYLREELPTVAFKASTQTQKGNLGQRSLPAATSGAGALQGSESLGADTLLQLLKNYSRNQKVSAPAWTFLTHLRKRSCF